MYLFFPQSQLMKDDFMKQFGSLTLAAFLTFSAFNSFAYDVVDRFKLIDDKLKTEQMLRPIGHDFFIGFLFHLFAEYFGIHKMYCKLFNQIL